MQSLCFITFYYYYLSTANFCVSFIFLQFTIHHGYQRFDSCIGFIEIVQGFWEEDDSRSPFLPSMLGNDFLTMFANIVLPNF